MFTRICGTDDSIISLILGDINTCFVRRTPLKHDRLIVESQVTGELKCPEEGLDGSNTGQERALSVP